MSQDQERRRFHRFPFEAQGLLLIGNSGRMPCDLMDLSINGALVRLENEIEIASGHSGELGLRLRGLIHGDQVEMQMGVDAVRTQGALVGCRFVSVDAESFEHLRNLVAENLGDPSLLDRELTKLDYWPGIAEDQTD